MKKPLILCGMLLVSLFLQASDKIIYVFEWDSTFTNEAYKSLNGKHFITTHVVDSSAEVIISPNPNYRKFVAASGILGIMGPDGYYHFETQPNGLLEIGRHIGFFYGENATPLWEYLDVVRPWSMFYPGTPYFSVPPRAALRLGTIASWRPPVFSRSACLGFLRPWPGWSDVYGSQPTNLSAYATRASVYSADSEELSADTQINLVLNAAELILRAAFNLPFAMAWWTPTVDSLREIYPGIDNVLKYSRYRAYMSQCPVDLSITAPDGRVFNKTIHEIEGAHYLEIFSPEDIEAFPFDIVIIPNPLEGDYMITVTPVDGAQESDTFSLFSVKRENGKLTENVIIENQTINNQQYVFSDSGELSITLDIKPDDMDNVINSKSKGVIPVAVLSTSEINALTIEPATITFGVTGHEASPVRYAYEDIDNDGDLDLVLKFRTEETGLLPGNNCAFIRGRLQNGRSFQGSDLLKIIK